jgi:hypothetical protein
MKEAVEVGLDKSVCAIYVTWIDLKEAEFHQGSSSGVRMATIVCGRESNWK